MSPPNEIQKKHSTLTSLGSITTFFATSVGVPFESIIKMTGLNPSALMDPDSRIPEKFMLEIFRLLAKLPSEKNLSLELAQIVPFTFLGSPWRFLSRAPDIRTMCTLIVQNQKLFSEQLELEWIETATEAILRMSHPFDEIDEGVGGEVCVGVSARIIREYFGDDTLARVQFRHPARKPLSVYKYFFKVPVTFQANFNAVFCTREVLNRPNKKAGIETRESIEWHLARLRHEQGKGDTDGLADIREAIERNAMKGDYTVFGLAQRMAMSIRSLQRRISAAGTSASTLLDKARYAKSLELLANKRISIDKIASQLGFSDERSFRKAFQRWSQKTPALIRREMKQED